jgi:hypothetical protein
MGLHITEERFAMLQQQKTIIREGFITTLEINNL